MSKWRFRIYLARGAVGPFATVSIRGRELGGARGWSGVAEGISEIAEISLLLSLAIQRKKEKNAWETASENWKVDLFQRGFQEGCQLEALYPRNDTFTDVDLDL